MHLTRPVRIVAVVAKFDLSDEVVRAMGAKHRYSRGVRTATCEGFKHAQQHLAQGLCVRSRLIKVTDNSAHHHSSIRIVYCKYYRSNNFLTAGILCALGQTAPAMRFRSPNFCPIARQHIALRSEDNKAGKFFIELGTKMVILD